jgi:hypothetical protein
MACASAGVDVRLVDEAGAAVSARGEFRSSDARGASQTFECPDADRDDIPVALRRCRDGAIQLFTPNLSPENGIDVRFELADGSPSAWQRLALELTRHTDPDFNGAGCPCTWYTAAPAPVVVPLGARLAPD